MEPGLDRADGAMGDESGVKLRSFRAGIGRDDEALAQDDPHRLFDMLGAHDAQREYRRDAVEAPVHRLMAYDLGDELPNRRARQIPQQQPVGVELLPRNAAGDGRESGRARGWQEG